MSTFLACLIAAIAFLAGLLVAMCEQIRVALRFRDATARAEQASCDVELAGPHFAVRQAASLPQNAVKRRVSATAPEARAAMYRQVLDCLGDDLDQDIAEWEAVLEEFPQVLFSGDVPTSEEPQRSRRVDWEEQSMIVRLSKTGFAPEEIALWLNLPVERVQEILNRA